MKRFVTLLAASWPLLLYAPAASGHGGVVEEEDLCVIKVNYLRGHFKIYQPRIDGHKEYCEDLPNATESVFVMEYEHDSLREAAVDFRIIRDVTGKRRFARWEDVAEIDDIDAVTVFYQAPAVDPDVLTVLHDFEEEGHFIGVVTASVPGDDNVHRAVFPFEVGYTGFGYLPLFIVLLLAIQLQWFVMSGRWKKWRDKRGSAALVVIAMLVAADTHAEEWRSERNVYTIHVESSLEPIEINTMHSWTLLVSRDGEPVEGATLSVTGGMPEHDHGLPTNPRVTAELGDGKYLLEGMRFHMSGYWEVRIEVMADESRDTVTVVLNL